MSFEKSVHQFESAVSEADLQAAIELIQEDPQLSGHPRVKQLLDSEFVDEQGRQIDPGNFLAAVKNAQEAQPTETSESYEVRIGRILDAMAIHSEPTR